MRRVVQVRALPCAPCGYDLKAMILAFQASREGSIPSIRSLVP
jgi:hypothetical protein